MKYLLRALGLISAAIFFIVCLVWLVARFCPFDRLASRIDQQSATDVTVTVLRVGWNRDAIGLRHHVTLARSTNSNAIAWLVPLIDPPRLTDCANVGYFEMRFDRHPTWSPSFSELRWAEQRRDIVVPFYMVALLTGTFSLIAASRELGLYVKRRRGPRAGACRVCGYDLRATPDRCPECGAIPAERPVARSAGSVGHAS